MADPAIVRRKWVLLVPSAVLLALVCASGAASETSRWIAARYIEEKGFVGLRWLPFPAEGVKEYVVLRRMPGDQRFTVLGETVERQYFDRNIRNRTKYVYAVVALDESGKEMSTIFREVVVALRAKQAARELLPPRWKGVEVRYGGFDFDCVMWLNWRPAWPDDTGVEIAYNIYRRDVPDGEFTMIGSTSHRRCRDEYYPKGGGRTVSYSLTALDGNFTESARSEVIHGGCFFRFLRKDPGYKLDGALNKALNSDDPLSQAVASLAMDGATPPRDVENVLRKGIMSKDSAVRWKALAGLGLLRSGGESAFDAALHSTDQRIQETAARLLRSSPYRRPEKAP